MNWGNAQQNVVNQPSLQTGPAQITILATGVNPISTDNELGANITQYNATASLSSTDTLPTESLKDVDDSGKNPGEGSIDCEVSGCLTDNKTLMCGAASFGPYPVDINMLRIASTQDPDGASETAIDTALMWSLNNQTKTGVITPVNLSYGVQIGPPNDQGTPLWLSPDIVQYGQSLYNINSILVVAAGDSPGTWTGANASIPTGIVVAQGSDPNNDLVNTLPSYGSGYGLTTVYNDPIAAPATVQPCIGPGPTFIPASWFGTSFAAPAVSALIAVLRTVNPNLSCQAAFNMIVSTGAAAGPSTPAISPPYTVTVKVPNFTAAIAAAAASR
jgi:hypothetical protein